MRSGLRAVQNYLANAVEDVGVRTSELADGHGSSAGE
jgi:hypothetical protein